MAGPRRGPAVQRRRAAARRRRRHRGSRRSGAKILDTLDEAIRLRDKVLLVLSKAAIASGWVEDEVTKAFAEERQRGAVSSAPR
jgi:hypothetical protein